jgi:hypothetical protein
MILFGNEEGTAESAQRFGLVPDVRYNEYATPLLNDLFEKVQHLANCSGVRHVNVDTLLLSDFMRGPWHSQPARN